MIEGSGSVSRMDDVFKDKKGHKKSQNSRVSCYFFLMIEGSGTGSRSVTDPACPKTSGSATLVSSSVVDPWHFDTDPNPRIRTTELQIWIRILLFRQWLTKCQKIRFFQSFRAYYFLKVHLHQSSKSQKKSQNSRNQGFSYFLCFSMKGSGSVSVQIMTDLGGSKPKDPTDPDPQDWFLA